MAEGAGEGADSEALGEEGRATPGLGEDSGGSQNKEQKQEEAGEEELPVSSMGAAGPPPSSHPTRQPAPAASVASSAEASGLDGAAGKAGEAEAAAVASLRAAVADRDAALARLLAQHADMARRVAAAEEAAADAQAVAAAKEKEPRGGADVDVAALDLWRAQCESALAAAEVRPVGQQGEESRFRSFALALVKEFSLPPCLAARCGGCSIVARAGSRGCRGDSR